MNTEIEKALIEFCQAAMDLAESTSETNYPDSFYAARNKLIESAGFSDIDEANPPSESELFLTWIWNEAADSSSTGG